MHQRARHQPARAPKINEQIADGDRVVTRWTAGGTHQSALQGIPATGRSARISGTSSTG